jgi:hypothetical protein
LIHFYKRSRSADLLRCSWKVEETHISLDPHIDATYKSQQEHIILQDFLTV